MRRRGWFWFTVLLALTGCGGGSLLWADDHSNPVISWVDISRVSASNAVQVDAKVEDTESGVASVSVVALDTSGAKQTLAMRPQTGANLFAVQLPSTVSRIQVFAQDRAGHTALSLETGVPPLPPF